MQNLLNNISTELHRNNYALPKAFAVGALISGSLCFLCTGTLAAGAAAVAMSVTATALSVFAKQALRDQYRRLPNVNAEIIGNGLSTTFVFVVRGLFSPTTATIHLFASLCFSTLPRLFTDQKTPVIFV